MSEQSLHCLWLKLHHYLLIDFETGILSLDECPELPKDTTYGAKEYAERKRYNTDTVANNLRLYKEICSIFNRKYCVSYINRIARKLPYPFDVFTLAKDLREMDIISEIDAGDPFAIDLLCLLQARKLQEKGVCIVGYNMNGIVYIEDDIVRIQDYLLRPSLYCIDKGCCPDYLKSFLDSRDIICDPWHVKNFYQDKEISSFVGKDVQELVTHCSNSAVPLIDSVVSKVCKPFINELATGDICITCEVTCCRYKDSWEATRDFIKENNRSIVDLILCKIAESSNFKKLGIPLNFFSVDSIRFTRDFIVVYKLGIKKGIIEQLKES